MEVIHKIGRRKTSVARVYMSEGKGNIMVNKKSYSDFFDTAILQYKIQQPFSLTETKDKFDLSVTVKGGGVNGQAEAIRLAISRALVEFNEEFKPVLKSEGLMTRDPRMVERKKFGQKKARKKFQFSKR
ncbi:30S ribosomal protein S9 [Flavobacteriaceae bacterium]|jgi:small subunit ribosomal protein S9|nr:30S ribosomal protein S9 [Cryomorphaceae bacterium]MCH1443784.1 30S ribosomal protein S9 [Flavobacteriaceae bacterium]MDA8547668.1 30S ribosomal protein S9 [Flavobacteriaceae bacterium]MDA9882945.1 30S ribosomal protein S9 [Flavobacteriaceae bacterium]MDC3219030.1 30S ribosomal protein S9 [Flavobacteriaceae bacterium]|tara:strand:+ start:1914 stop:2300 length:387 start_codon:yes stop_codon:yes gene_type:complete